MNDSDLSRAFWSCLYTLGLSIILGMMCFIWFGGCQGQFTHLSVPILVGPKVHSMIMMFWLSLQSFAFAILQRRRRVYLSAYLVFLVVVAIFLAWDISIWDRPAAGFPYIPQTPLKP